MSLAHLDPETMDDWAPVGDEASWRRCIDAWDGGVGARRRKKVGLFSRERSLRARARARRVVARVRR